jgi:hypothetical protein
MKYTIEITGWEYHIQTKSLNLGQAKQARWDIDNLSDLADLYLNGEGDFEVCALDNSGNSPLSLTVYDENNNLVFEVESVVLSHYSEVEELCDKDWDKDVDINPEYSDNYENTLYLEKDYSGSTFYYEVESDKIPKKEDFLYSSLCIGTPNGDIDLIGELIFKSDILEGELESGKHKGTFMNLYTSGGENIEIYD